MIFGWGKKKQDRQEFTGQTPESKEITLEQVPDIVSKIEELRKTQTLSDINILRNNTKPLIDDLIIIGNLLEKDSLNIDDIDKHLAIIVVRGKKQVIDIIKKGVVHLPKISSLEDAEELNLVLSQTLKKVGDVLGRQTRVIHIFAKKYANQLKENLEVMKANHEEIDQLLKNFESTKSLSNDVRNAIDQINDLTEMRKERSQMIISTNKDAAALQKEISAIQNSIAKIHSSDRYKKYMDLKNTLNAFSKQRLNIRDEINSQFTKISRPLGRYEYASSLEKDQKKVLSELVANPSNVITAQNRDTVIIILENIYKGVMSGTISVKDVTKASFYITETKKSLDKFLNQISQYNKIYAELKEQLDAFLLNDLVALERDLAKNISFKDRDVLKSNTFQDEIEEMNSKISGLMSDIQDKVRETSNIRYILLMS